jgi:hypothetical protein
MTASIEAFEPCDRSAMTAQEFWATEKESGGFLVAFLLSLVFACSVYVAYIRLLPKLKQQHLLESQSKIMEEEDLEDEVIKVSWGKNLYKDDVNNSDAKFSIHPSPPLELNGRNFDGNKFYTVKMNSY